ncbi:MAG TPA: TonB family protein [Bryobacteraceae bacterium]|nr:TonB family protein [Bryobacteraceae bacterium]
MSSGSRKWMSFAASVACHVGILTFLVWAESVVEAERAAMPRTMLAELPDYKPPKDKIISYNLGKSVPQISPEPTAGATKEPRGHLSKTHKVLVAKSDKPQSTRQIIRQPDHPEPLPKDVPAPNLVAIAAPVPKPVKEFVAPPPVRSGRDVQVELADAAPMIAGDSPVKDTLNVKATKLPPKTFVAPKARSGAEQGVATAQLDLPTAPSAAAPDSMSSGLQALMLGVSPANAPPPKGSRSGSFAEANVAGAPNGGGAHQPGSITEPGITANGGALGGGAGAGPGFGPGGGLGGRAGSASAASRAPSIPPRKIVKEIVLPPVNRTVSVPLRPSSRVIPLSVESQFARRNVYTLVIPGPSLRQYPGDWILWFSERGSEGQLGGALRAPLPVRKYVTAEAEETSASSASVQLSMVIDKDGKVVSPKVLKGAPSEAFRARALEEIATWEFEPARRNGIAVDVDAVIELQLSVAVASER